MALALILVIEGLLYAAIPEQMKALLDQMREMPASTLRQAGLVAAVLGIVLAYLVRGFV